MNTNRRYSIFLYTGFACLLVVFISLAVFHFKQIVTANENLQYITTNNDAQLQSTMDMGVAVRERVMLLWNMSFEKDIFNRDELFLKFSAFGAHFSRARSKYLITHQTPSERNLFLTLEKEINRRAPEMRALALMLMDDESHQLSLSHLKIALTDQVVISDILDTMIRLQQTQNEEARKQVADKTEEIIFQLIVWTLIFIMAVILFARVVVQVANKQSKLLSKVNDELNKLARYDHLTNLPNRLFLSEHLKLTLAHAKRHDKNGALLYIDIDNFKPINDTYGHSVGDAYLQAVSIAMKDLLRDSDVLVRFGGDEFVVVLYEISSEKDVTIVADKLLQKLSSEYALGDISVSASGSIGICFFPETDMTVDGLLDSADAAMYQAKQAGKNRYSIFQPLDDYKKPEEKLKKRA